MELLTVSSLPENALDAAAHFHAKIMPQIRDVLETADDGLVIALPAAAYDHDDWRRGTVRDLAREYAPKRVAMIAGGDEAAIAKTLEYLRSAPGITGQLMNLTDAAGAN